MCIIYQATFDKAAPSVLDEQLIRHCACGPQVIYHEGRGRSWHKRSCSEN